MALGMIKVTTAELDTASNKVKTLAERYKEDYTSLYTIVNSIATNGSWVGTDEAAFVDQIGQFRDDFDSMYEEMVHYSDFLSKAAEAYRRTQTGITSDVSKKLSTDA